MRLLTVLIIFISLSIKAYSQKWKFHKADKADSGDHKYEYWFHINNPNFDLDNVYQINSMEKLKKKEIINIINCVRNNRQEFNICMDKNRYYVTLHI